MWSYNYNLYDPYQNSLMHYGIPGMKWGHRKTPEYEKYKSERKAFKQARKEFKKTRGSGFGIKGISNYKKALNKYNAAESKFISEKAKYKASKSEKAERKYYTKEMRKSGIRGSALDTSSGGRSTRLYNQIKKEKGKAYADRIEKRVQAQSVAALIGSAAVAVGSSIALAYLENKD